MSLRVFLDAADIIRIADTHKWQEATEAEVRSLEAAFREHQARLFVTRALLQDLFARADIQTRERFVLAFERFAPVLLSVEDGEALLVEEVVDIRRVLSAPMRDGQLRDAAGHQSRLHEGLKAARAALQAAGGFGQDLSNDALGLYVKATIEGSRTRTSPLVAVEPLIKTSDIRLSAHQLEALRARLRGADGLLREAVEGPTDLVEALRPLLAAGPLGEELRAIASFIGESLRDLRREPKFTDIADAMHVGNVVHVDIFTCDRHTRAILERAGLHRHRAMVLPNRDLLGVTSAIQKSRRG